MKARLCRTAITPFLFSAVLFAAENNTSAERPSPEMAKVANALAGNWNNTETMERGEFFPNGGERKGVSSCRLSSGDVSLICEGDSDGSAGPLHHLIVIWWDGNANVYRFFTCFQDGAESNCRVRGTAHWEGNDFVNDYSEDANGKSMKMRDSFVKITHESHVLVAAIEDSDGHMKTLITTRSTRR